MILIALHLYAFLAIQSITGHPKQASSPAETASVHRFVQGFYDWYTPRALKGDAEVLALKSKSAMFSPELRRALLEDRQAQAKDKDEVVGLDFDPFLNSQDLAKSYTVGKVEHKGQAWLVSVYASYTGQKPAAPDVTAKVEKTKTGWRFTNFLYEKDNLLSVLQKLKHDRTH